MPPGYTGRILYVDLSSGVIEAETPPDSLYRDYIGGYGIAAKIAVERQKPGVDPLGSENILGFATGPLTASPAPYGSRYYVTAKSPLTGTWGDANGGGQFGPQMKMAGLDALFITGISPRPVYLLVRDGQGEIREAAHLWGKDSVETEQALKAEWGKEATVACIGQAGERLSFISGIVNDGGRLAARAGVGAVAGSKRLKAIVVIGNQEVPMADRERATQLRREYLQTLKGPAIDRRRKYGTSAAPAPLAAISQTPAKNWGGSATLEFTNAAAISDDSVAKYEVKKYLCWRCPTACGAHLDIKEGPYAGTAHRPEYETLASFGTMTLNDNVESIIKCNDICNRYGLDTISAGTTIAFAIECYENGVISREDTGGIVLRWGGHEGIVALTEMLARREGFGDILADGVARAAERIGNGAERFAVHIQGSELGMHDPKIRPESFTRYLDAKPGNHMQGPGAEGFHNHIVNCAGLCAFGGYRQADPKFIPGFMAAATGWERSLDELLKAGERIANIRQIFNVREGIHPARFSVSGRIIGSPPIGIGPLAEASIDLEAQVREMYAQRQWDLESGRPSPEKLRDLGMEDLVTALWQ